MRGIGDSRMNEFSIVHLLAVSMLILCTLIGGEAALAAPYVTSSTPPAGAGNVPVTTTITATFNEALDPATVTTGSITLSRPAKAKAIAARQQIIALRDDGTVVAWGENIGREACVPPGLTDVTAVAAGQYCSLALKKDGTLVGWGDDGSGNPRSCDFAGSSDIIAISLGSENDLAFLKADGTASILNGAYGGSLPDVIAVATGDGHSVVLKRDGTVVDGATGTAFGSGFTAIAAGGDHIEAMKADGTAYSSLISGWTQRAEGVTAISAGRQHTLALKNDGTVIAWGNEFDNAYGQMTVPDGLANITSIAAGGDYSFALKADGTVVPWGGSSSFGQAAIPSGVSGLTGIAAGGGHAAAVKNDGTVVGWGHNDSHQTETPPGLSNVIATAAGGRHTVALKADGTVVAWGANDHGQRTVPTDLSPITAIAAGANHTVALKADGTVAAWGDNTYGQSMVPGNLTDVIAIAAAGDTTVALKSGGTVAAWGDNRVGQTTVPGDLTDVAAIAAGGTYTVALKRGGTVVTWGEQGRPPVPYDLANVTAIAAGPDHTVALKDDGTVVAWRKNIFDVGQATVPPGLSGVTKIAAANHYTYALRADGTIVPFGAYPPVFSPLGPFEAAIPATVTYDAFSRTATITPATPLATGTTYDVTLNTGVRTATGEHLPADVSWSFTTDLPQNLKLTITGQQDTYFESLNAALAAVSQTSESTIALRAMDFIEPITFNNCGAVVTLAGGYDAAFTSIEGPTVIRGSLTIACGTLIADNLVIS